MENNEPQKIDKKLIIKKILVNTGAAITFALILVFITYGKAIPVKATLIAIGIAIVVIPMSIFFAFKYRNYITVAKIRKFFLVLGILTIIVNLALVLIEGGNSNYYMGIGLGLLFIYYSRAYKKGKNSLSKNGTI